MFEAGVFCVYFNNLEWGFFCQDPLSLSVINRKWELYYFFILFGLPLFFFLLVLDICATQILADVLPSWTDDPLSCSA